MRSHKWAGFKSVLCPIDFSEQSRLALQYAQAIATRSRARLTVLYVNDPLLAAAAAALRDRQLQAQAERELRTFIDASMTSTSRRRCRVKSSVLVGPAVAGILKAARTNACDLIVLGTHGLTGVGRIVIGSTTLGVLRRTSVPVLAVPPLFKHATSLNLEKWPGTPIVAAVELGRGASKQVAVAGQIACWFGASLLLAHVVSDRVTIVQAQRQLDALARGQRRAATTTRAVSGSIAEELAALAVSERVGLVITALRDRRGWFDAGRGSISYHVLARAVAPVLAYPQSWRPH